MKKKALLTGISGQDGSFLAEFLLEKDYEVYGIVRRSSVAENQTSRLINIWDKIKDNLFYADITDFASLLRVINIVKPDEIYNLAAQSHVRISFDEPIYTTETIVQGTLNLLEIIRLEHPHIKLYNASSCLPAGTTIIVKKEIQRTRDNKKQSFLQGGSVNKIENIIVGDEILSFNEKTSKKEYKKVKAIGNRIANNMFTLKLSNRNELRLSGNHPVFVVDKGWVRTDSLKIEDKVLQYIYPGLRGRITKGLTNIELYGEKRAKEIHKKNSESQKNRTFVHPWKGKTLNEVYKNNKKKLKQIRHIFSVSKIGIAPWNSDIKNSKNKKHIMAWEKAKKNIGKSNKKLWENKEWAEKQFNKLMIRTRKNTWLPNKSEIKFQEFLEEICPGEFKYNSFENEDFLTIERKIPDFININNKKKLIEYNGDYWHNLDGRRENDKKRIQLFKSIGYDVLEIFESEFKKDKNKVENKVKTFLYNPQVEIIEIIEILKHDYSEKVYDIQVEDNHNFFAYGVLVHNSEMFGNNIDADGFQRETTPMNPVSPYGCAKTYSYNIVRNYRHSYGLFLSNGILFNHESTRRGLNFVTNKVVKAAVEIILNKRDTLPLGNLDAARDWGHAKDYVKAMWMMLQHDKPDDFVCATGTSHTVRELVEYVFKSLGTDYKKYVTIDERYYRPEELNVLKGDSTKIQRELGWKRDYNFTTMLDEMVRYWLEKLG